MDSDNDENLYTCVIGVANKIVEIDSRENVPIHQAIDNAKCQSKCPYFTAGRSHLELYKTETCKSSIQLNLNMFVDESGHCAQCNDLHPWCRECP